MSQDADFLIVGINYFPEPTGNAPYTTDLAEMLAKHGSTRVITGIPHYPWWEKREVQNRPSIKSLEVIRRFHSVPTKQGNFNRALMEITFGLAVISGGNLRAKKVILISPAMLSSALVALWMKLFRRRSKLILWVQDLYEQGLQETETRSGLFTRWVVTAERWLLKNSDHVVFAHKGFVQAKANLGLRNVSTVSNWSQFSYDSEALPSIVKEGIVVLHIGNMGVKQGLDNVVSAAKIAEERNQPISFIMLGAGNQIEGLKDLAGNCSNITFVAPVSDEELSGYLNSADVLLVNERPGVREMSVPSKLTTYFQTGKPVLVCSEPDSLAAREVLGNEIGFWTRSGNPEGLLKALLDLDLKKGTDIALAAKLHADRHLSKEAALRSFKSTIDLA